MTKALIVVGAVVSYTAKVAGKPDKVYADLTVMAINKDRANVKDKKGKEHDLPLGELVFVSAPEAKEVKAPRVPKPAVPYDRAAINAQVKADREAGKVRLYPKKEKYVVGTSTSPDARKTIDIADEVATKLRSVSLDQMYVVLGEYVSAERVAECKTRYAGKNIGMQRMNVGNVIRGAINAKAKAAAKAEAAANAPKVEAKADAPATGKAAAGKKAQPAQATA